MFKERIEYAKSKKLGVSDTRVYLVEPILKELGIDCTDIHKVRRDVKLDRVGIVSYYIEHNPREVILVDVEGVGKNLQKGRGFLKEKFNADKRVKFAIRTNGLEYHLYTDIEKAGQMDETPVVKAKLEKGMGDFKLLQYPKMFERQTRNEYIAERERRNQETMTEVVDQLAVQNKEQITKGIKEVLENMLGTELPIEMVEQVVQKIVKEKEEEKVVLNRSEIEQYAGWQEKGYIVESIDIAGRKQRNINREVPSIELFKLLLDSLSPQQLKELEGVNTLYATQRVGRPCKYKQISKKLRELPKSVGKGYYKVRGYYVNVQNNTDARMRLFARIIDITGVDDLEVVLVKDR